MKSSSKEQERTYFIRRKTYFDMEAPAQKKDIDLDNIREACSDYIAYISSDSYHEDKSSDYKNYIFETCIKEIYGEGIWDYINEKT